MHRQWPETIVPEISNRASLAENYKPQLFKLPSTRRFRYHLRWLIIALTTAFGTVAGMEMLDTPLSLTPPTTCITPTPKTKTPQNRCLTPADFAKYTNTQFKSAFSPKIEDKKLSPRHFALTADNNRDGIINEKDISNNKTWTWQTGPLILFNMDDDDNKGQPDWQDNIVNGSKDEEDLAKITLELGREFEKDFISLKVDPVARPYINIFQKTNKGWILLPSDGSLPLAYTQKLILGVEAKQFANRNWNGLVNIQAIATEKNKIIAEDHLQMRVAPWLMLPNTAKVKEIYVSDAGLINQKFIAQIQQALAPTGTKVNIEAGGTTWKQDTMEIGYVQFPESKKLRQFNVVLNGVRPESYDGFPRSLLNSDFGWFQVGNPRPLDPLNQWTDWFGNLEVTPAVPGYPLGRIYYGNAGSVAFHPDVIAFLKAQEVQGPPLDIDTSWLAIRHVDEIISFIPTPAGKPLMMIVSPEEGVNLLKKLDKKGYGNKLMNVGLSYETTVKNALNNRSLIQYNLQLQRDKLNPLEAKLKREFNLSDDQIIRIPAMFVMGGSSYWPNMVNSVVVNGRLLVSNPRGVVINGQDLTQLEFRRRIYKSNLPVYFLDDEYYHELRGNTHCATNTRRLPMKQPFWEKLSIK